MSTMVVARLNPWRWIETWLTRWLISWHGSGEAHQYMFYRCHGCRSLLTWRRIRAGGCACRISNKVSPAVLAWREKARALVLPWTL